MRNSLVADVVTKNEISGDVEMVDDQINNQYETESPYKERVKVNESSTESSYDVARIHVEACTKNSDKEQEIRNTTLGFAGIPSSLVEESKEVFSRTRKRESLKTYVQTRSCTSSVQ